MKQTCDGSRSCLPHGLVWPCDLCVLENASFTTCQRCGLSGAAGTFSSGERVCAGWLLSAPTYPPAVVDSTAQEPLTPLKAEHPAERWLRRIEKLGLAVDRAQGTITFSRSENPSDASATAARLRFSDGSTAVLCRPWDAEFARRFDSFEFKKWAPEIRFDDEVLHWKELELIEPSDVTTDEGEHGALPCGSMSSLWVQPWTELRSMKMAVLRAHEPDRNRVDESTKSQRVERRDTSDGADYETGSGDRPLTIVRDLDSERDTGVQIVSVEAWEIEDGAVAIVGELKSVSGKKLDDYRELQFVVYDAADKILGRGYTNFSSFGHRQTFDEEVSGLRSGGRPAKLRIFPSGG